MKATEKLDQAKELITGLSQDMAKLLSMAQVTIPVGEALIRTTVVQVDARIQQIKILLGIKEEPHGGER